MQDEDKTREQLIDELRETRQVVAEGRQLQDQLSCKESELRQSEETLRLLIENAPIAMIVTSGVKQTLEMVNHKFEKLFGYTQEDVPDIEHWWSLAFPKANNWQDLAESWNQKVDAAIKSQSQIEPVETI